MFRLAGCASCHTLFLDPPPAPADIPGFYPPRYWWAAPSGSLTRLEALYRRLALHDHVAFVERALARAAAESPGVRMLDVGCGPGTLIGILKTRGRDVIGLDFSPEAVGIAVRDNGVPAVTAALERACFPDGSFDVVTMFHVLEHVLDPRAVLGEVSRLLRPGGRIVLQVPNIDSWQSRLLGVRWWGLHVPRHIINYSARSVQQLVTSTGFAIARVRHFNLRDNAPALASSLCPWLDPQVRAMRQHRAGHTESAPESWIKHGLYLALVCASLPFAGMEAASSAGATVMIEAVKG